MALTIAPSYKEAVTRFYANHPNELMAAHLSHLGNSALDEATQQEVIYRHNPGLAHHPDLAAIGKMPQGDRAGAVQRLHERESAGPETENSETNEYIRKRKRPTKDTSVIGRYGARR